MRLDGDCIPTSRIGVRRSVRVMAARPGVSPSSCPYAGGYDRWEKCGLNQFAAGTGVSTPSGNEMRIELVWPGEGLKIESLP